MELINSRYPQASKPSNPGAQLTLGHLWMLPDIQAKNSEAAAERWAAVITD